MNILVAQSGGPSSVINATLSGIIKGYQNNAIPGKLLGSLNGIQGVIDRNIIDLTETFTDSDSLNLLAKTPAMYLGSCRYKLDESNTKDYQQIFYVLTLLDIECFIYIGGNDSMDTIHKLCVYGESIESKIQFIGLPKTIDNDIAVTDHTPGFGSAAKFVSSTILNIAHDAFVYNSPSITLVETMGRNAGWLTAAASLSRNDYFHGPDMIFLPEVEFSMTTFINSIKEKLQQKKNLIIVVSEGIKDSKGQYICQQASKWSVDSFGHTKLTGAAKILESQLKSHFDFRIRSIELNVLQRCYMHMASQTDLDEAQRLGVESIHVALEGLSGIMLAFNRLSTSHYAVDIIPVPLKDVANHEKKIPRSWINDAGNHVQEDCIDYLLPLIQGEVELEYRLGVPKYVDIKHLQ